MSGKRLFLFLITALFLCACSAKAPVIPFKPLAEVTLSLDKASEFNNAAADFLNQHRPDETPEPQSAELITEENPFNEEITPELIENTSDPVDFFAEEDSFFAPEEENPVEDTALDSYFSASEIEGAEPEDELIFNPDIVPTETDPFGTEFAFASEPAAMPQVQPTEEPEPFNPYDRNGRGLITYTMQPGEDLTCLARRFNFDLTGFISMNGITSPLEGNPGDSFILPDGIGSWSVYDGSRTLMRHPAVYTVQREDTMFGIACKFGDVYPEDIASANGLVYGSPLTPGERITIP